MKLFQNYFSDIEHVENIYGLQWVSERIFK